MHVSERPIEWRPYVTHAPTVIEALRFTFYDVFFRYSAKTSLMPQLWTMKYELFGSVAVFVSLLAFGRWRFREAGYIGVAGCLYFVHPIYCAFRWAPCLRRCLLAASGCKLPACGYSPQCLSDVLGWLAMSPDASPYQRQP